jgi:hypothetical protein
VLNAKMQISMTVLNVLAAISYKEILVVTPLLVLQISMETPLQKNVNFVILTVQVVLGLLLMNVSLVSIHPISIFLLKSLVLIVI